MIQVYHNPNFLDDCLKGRISDLSSCIHVANVRVTELEHAYGLTQNIDGKIWRSNELIEAIVPEENRRSTSWGDFMIRDGIRYYIDGLGYKVLLDEAQLN